MRAAAHCLPESRFIRADEAAFVQGLHITFYMDLLVAWEALSILLPMASTSFPIPLIVLQEERARVAASVKRADLIFII